MTAAEPQDRLATARAAVGVTGGAPLSVQGGWLAGGAALALTTSTFGVLARLLADRHAIGAVIGDGPSAADDAVVRILLSAVFFAVVLALFPRGRRSSGVRVAVGSVSAAAASGVLVAEVTSAGVDVAVLLSALAMGAVLPAVPAALASRVEPGARVLAMRMAGGGLPLAFLLASCLSLADAPEVGSGALAVLGLGGLVLARIARGDGPGRDQAAVHDAVGSPVGDEVPVVPFGQLVRRVLARETIVQAGILGFMSGIVLLTLPLFVVLRLGHHHQVSIDDQTLSLAMSFGLALAFLAIGTPDVILRHARSVGGPSRRVAWLLPIAALSLLLAVVLDLASALLVLAAIATALIWSSWSRAELAAVIGTPHDVRVGAATFMTVLHLFGAVVSIAVVGGVDRRFGTGWAIALLALFVVAVVGAATRVAAGADKDLERTLSRFLSAVEVDERRAAGREVPLLEARRVDFSYGQVQVLFGVDFTVDEGEMVALLGTNGAGKSTLLRVISGLGLPSRGLVRFDGNDVTYASPSDRVHAGIAQVPGGKAVFGPLSVVENLRVHGHALGRDRAAVDAGIEAAFAQFPRLEERRDQMAQTLSGGEQQMLALSKALILKPRLLLIDELSLGLAPVIVGQLLAMVRQINAQGTAVVLVEQSVNVALSLAHHAYYMEKGEMRFDGPSQDLLDRPDVLRSVYLKGAAKGLGGGA